MTRIMVDLETLSTKPNAVIVAIGASTIEENPAKFYLPVNIETQPQAHICPATVVWWMSQSDDARRVFKEGATPISEALSAFASFCDKQRSRDGMLEMWGNGAAFDNVVLREAYTRHGVVPAPWSYREDRCFRTLRWMAPEVVVPGPEPTFVAHNALADAVLQAKQALALLHSFGVDTPEVQS